MERLDRREGGQGSGGGCGSPRAIPGVVGVTVPIRSPSFPLSLAAVPADRSASWRSVTPAPA
jgi:hypothetical protein